MVGQLDPVDDGDSQIRRGVEEQRPDVLRGRARHELPLLGQQLIDAELQSGQPQALQPGQGDRVPLDDFEQPVGDGRERVRVRGAPGGDGVQVALGRRFRRALEIHLDRGNVHLAAAREGPALDPAQRHARVDRHQTAAGVGELARRAVRPLPGRHGVVAELGRGGPDHVRRVPGAGGVPFEGLRRGQVRRRLAVQGPAGSVEVAGGRIVCPLRLGGEDGARISERTGEDRKVGLPLGDGQPGQPGDQAIGRHQPPHGAQGFRNFPTRRRFLERSHPLPLWPVKTVSESRLMSTEVGTSRRWGSRCMSTAEFRFVSELAAAEVQLGL